MKKIILMHVFSFIAISAMCQKMESGSSTIDGRPAAPKAATVQTSKAYAGYVAPAAEKKQVATQQTAKPVEVNNAATNVYLIPRPVAATNIEEPSAAQQTPVLSKPDVNVNQIKPAQTVVPIQTEKPKGKD